jgi:hypothetical protein
MKKAFKNHSDVCHKFNEQSQSEGRAGNIFFEGNKIYSYGYHYLLGEFISPNTILINNKGYSNSTSKHINILEQATRDKKQIEITRIELNLVLNELETLYKKLLNARKTLTYYFNSIIWLHNDFNINKNNLNGFYLAYNYSRGFQFIELSKACKEQKEKLNRIEEIRNLAFEYSQSKEYLTKIERAKELDGTKAQREKEKREKQRAEQIENFYGYKGSRIYWGEFDLLRLSKCGEYLETSQAVKIPIKEAQRYFKLFSSGAKLIGEKISQYITISNDNFLQIGCHKIEHKEANRIGEIISNL